MALIAWLKRLVGTDTSQDSIDESVQPATESERAVKAPLDDIQQSSGDAGDEES